METYIFLAIGLAIGLALGWLLASRRSGGTGEPTTLVADLAAARATVDAYAEQIMQLQVQVQENQKKQEQENKLFTELAPVKENLKSMQEAVAAMERQRAEQVTDLNATIRRSLESDEQLRRQTESLAQALSSNQLRGVQENIR